MNKKKIYKSIFEDPVKSDIKWRDIEQLLLSLGAEIGEVMIKYKGYIGVIEYDSEAHIFSGSVINTRTVITFQGSTVDEIEQEFKNSVDDYLKWCEEEGDTPEKPFSGKFTVRITPELHSSLAAQAALNKVSINAYVEQAISAYVEKANTEKLQRA